MQTNNHVLVHTLPTYSTSTSIFYVAIFSAIFVILVLTTVIATFYLRNKKNRDTTVVNSGPTFLTAIPRTTVSTSYSSFRRMPSYSLIDERSKDLQERITELTVQR